MDIYNKLSNLCEIISGSNIKTPVLIAFMNPKTGSRGRMVHGVSLEVMFMLDSILEMTAKNLGIPFDELLNMLKFGHIGGDHDGSFPGNL